VVTKHIPENLKDRPTYKGYVVPYSVMGEGGVPDFKTNDVIKVARCLRLRLCALCGMKMHKEIAFLGGDISGESKLYTDGPMHEECAAYAAQVCPHLAKGKDYAPLEDGSQPNPLFTNKALDVTVMLIVKDYEPVVIQVSPTQGMEALQAGDEIRRRVFKAGEEQLQLL